MNRQFKLSERAQRLFLYWIIILLLMTLLVTATYTWFTLATTPRVSNIGIYVNAPTGMMLSTAPSGAEWVHQLNFAEVIRETSPLRPVTWSEKEQRFYAAIYGLDGRQTGQWEPLSDANNANRDSVYGYYIKMSFYATSETAVKISLTDAVEVSEGVDGSGTFLIGAPVWNSESIMHSDGGIGAQNAMRIGLRFTPMEGNALSGPSEFFIYEPNCDGHLDDVQGYVDTPSIDGTPTLIDPSHIITQTTTTWTEADIVERDVVIKDMGDFLTDTYLYSLDAGEIVKIDMYVWLEGQDVDCVNQIGHKAQIMASVQFDADESGQSGMTPIP